MLADDEHGTLAMNAFDCDAIAVRFAENSGLSQHQQHLSIA